MAHWLPGQRLSVALGEGALSITFDDFPRTAWTEGGGVLDAHGVKGTYYVSGRFVGGRMDGQQQFADQDLQALRHAGHEVGCHTYDHLSALKVSPGKFARSISRNARFLAERLDGWRARSFAYPYGHISLSALRTVAATFESGRSVMGGCNDDVLQPFQLHSLALEAGRPEAADWARLVEEAALRRQWLIVVTHDVQARPSQFGCTPATLDALIGAAKAAGLRVAPVGTIMEAVSDVRRRPGSDRPSDAAPSRSAALAARR